MFYQTSILFFVAATSCNLITNEQDRKANEEYRLGTNWLHCGHTPLSKTRAFDVMKPCSKVIIYFNHCCVIHTECYRYHSKDKDSCDSSFYYCNENAINKYAATLDICWPWLKGSYAFLDFTNNYEKAPSIIYSGPFYIPQAPMVRSNVAEYFKPVYDNCSFYRLTVSSCAFGYEWCLRQENEGCGALYGECIPIAHERENATCSEALNNLRAFLLEPWP